MIIITLPQIKITHCQRFFATPHSDYHYQIKITNCQRFFVIRHSDLGTLPNCDISPVSSHCQRWGVNILAGCQAIDFTSRCLKKHFFNVFTQSMLLIRAIGKINCQLSASSRFFTRRSSDPHQQGSSLILFNDDDNGVMSVLIMPMMMMMMMMMMVKMTHFVRQIK